jgi:hypothetical protein
LLVPGSPALFVQVNRDAPRGRVTRVPASFTNWDLMPPCEAPSARHLSNGNPASFSLHRLNGMPFRASDLFSKHEPRNFFETSLSRLPLDKHTKCLLCFCR